MKSKSNETKYNRKKIGFCLAKKKRKIHDKPIDQCQKTMEKSTLTIDIRKYDVGTFANFDDAVKEPIKRFDKKYYFFPLCEDLKETSIFSELSIFGRNKLESYVKRSNERLPNQLNENISNISPSLTLKDVLDRNHLTVASSPTFSGNSFIDEISIISSTPNYSNNFSIDLSFNTTDSEQIENKWKINEKDISLISSNQLKEENTKIYDYFETTTLLPIGQGIVSLIPMNSATLNSTEKCDIFHRNLSDSNSEIEIPPKMPPLLTINRNGISSFRSARLPSRPIVNLNHFECNKKYTNDNKLEDDYQDIDNISLDSYLRTDKHTMKLIQTNSKRPPSNFINNILQPKGNMARSSDEIGNFPYLPTKLSLSNSALAKEKRISYGFHYTTDKNKQIPDLSLLQISTAF